MNTNSPSREEYIRILQEIETAIKRRNIFFSIKSHDQLIVLRRTVENIKSGSLGIKMTEAITTLTKKIELWNKYSIFI